MKDLLTLIEGAEVECIDGNRARLDRTLVDSTTKQLTHLVVEPEGESGRLVPLSHLQRWFDHAVLDCSSTELETFDLADVPRLVPDVRLAVMSGARGQRVVFDHNIPDGEVEVRAGEEVRTGRGHLGRLHGVVVDTEDGSIQQLLVDVGHLFRRELSVPASFVTAFEPEAIRVEGSKRQLKNELAA